MSLDEYIEREGGKERERESEGKDVVINATYLQHTADKGSREPTAHYQPEGVEEVEDVHPDLFLAPPPPPPHLVSSCGILCHCVV